MKKAIGATSLKGVDPQDLAETLEKEKGKTIPMLGN